MSTKTPVIAKRVMDEQTVRGFVRRYCLSDQFPDDLMQLCVSMYFINVDRWSLDCDSFDFDKDCTSAIKKGDGWQSVFGTIIVKKRQVQTWKLKQCKANSQTNQWYQHPFNRNNFAARIGIIAVDSIQNCDANFSSSSYGYALSLSCGGKCNNDNLVDYLRKGPEYEDVITMTLDMNHHDYFGQLSFKINDIDCGVAFFVYLETKYCLAMSLFYQDNGFEILECE